MSKPQGAYKFLWNIMKNRKKAIALCAFLGALSILANVALLAASALLISRSALATSIMELFVLVAGVRFFGIFRALVRYLERLLSHSITLKLLAQLRVEFYRLICPLVPGALGLKQNSIFKGILSDIETLKYFYLRVVNAPLISFLVWVCVSSFLWFYQPAVAVIFAVSYLFAAVLLPWTSQLYLTRKSQKKDQLRLQLQIHLQDLLLGGVDLTCCGRAEDLSRTLLAERKDLLKAEDALKRLEYLGNTLNNLLANITLFGTLLFTAAKVSVGQLQGVYLAMLVICLWSAFEGVQGLPLAFAYARDSRSAADNILKLTAERAVECQNSSPPAFRNGGIEFKNVSFHYPHQNRDVLKNISFAIAPGEHIAIVGASAGGKSTIVQLLLGFQCPQSGQITIGGVDSIDLNVKVLSEYINVLSQDSYIFSATIRENLLLANNEAADEELWQALEQAKLADFVRSLPDELDSRLYTNGSNLSGGQRQRLALARMFLQKGEIIVVDEALQGLDRQSAQDIEEAVRQYAQNRTLIAITHDLSYLEAYERIMVIKEGEILAFAPIDELLKNCSYFRALYDLEQSRIKDKKKS